MQDATIHDGLTGEEVLELLPPIFRFCVDTEAVIYDLALPFHRDGHAYATDGRIAVRCKVPPAVAERIDGAKPERSRLPDVVELFARHGAIAFRPKPARLPEDCPPPHRVCHECQGFGLAEGYGEFIDYACCDCEGSRIVRNWDRVEVAPGFGMSAYFVGLLRGFGLKLYLPVDPGPPKKPHPFRFVGEINPGVDGWGDVEGYVMPMTETP